MGEVVDLERFKEKRRQEQAHQRFIATYCADWRSWFNEIDNAYEWGKILAASIVKGEIPKGELNYLPSICDANKDTMLFASKDGEELLMIGIDKMGCITVMSITNGAWLKKDQPARYTKYLRHGVKEYLAVPI